MDDFRTLADAVEADIRAGRVRPGARLLPQREFAHRRGIAPSTAGRVYRELVHRGLVGGEVGRGTFVLPLTIGPYQPLIDLEANFPVLADQPAVLAGVLQRALRPDALADALHPATPQGNPGARQTAATFLVRAGWRPDPAAVLFTAGGRQSIAAAIAAFVPPGGALGVEQLTYPIVKGIAARLGVRLVPIALDEHGLVPADLAAVHRATPLGAVYLQPSLHNPLGLTMPAERCAELTATLRRLDLVAIEDGVNAFLHDGTVLATHCADRVVHVDSLSKRIAAGLNLGFVIAPPALRERLGATIRSGGWSPTGLSLAMATGALADGTADRIVTAKRADAAKRQRLVFERLAGFTLRADPDAYYAWWELPDGWESGAFTAAAARHGIAVGPADAFAVRADAVPRAVRLSNSTPDLPALRNALDTLAALARGTPADATLADGAY